MPSQDFPPPRWMCPRCWGLLSPVGALEAVATSWAGRPVPPGDGPAPLGAAIPLRLSLGSNGRLGRTPRPPSRETCADGIHHPPPALIRQQLPPWQDSPSPQLLGPQRWGLPSPTDALQAAAAAWAGLCVPPAGWPTPLGAAIPQNPSLYSITSYHHTTTPHQIPSLQNSFPLLCTIALHHCSKPSPDSISYHIISYRSIPSPCIIVGYLLWDPPKKR